MKKNFVDIDDDIEYISEEESNKIIEEYTKKSKRWLAFFGVFYALMMLFILGAIVAYWQYEYSLLLASGILAMICFAAWVVFIRLYDNCTDTIENTKARTRY